MDEIEVLTLAAICRFHMGGPDCPDLFDQALTLGEKFGYVAIFARGCRGYGRVLSKLSAAFTPYCLSIDRNGGTISLLLCQRKSTGENCALLKIKLPTAKTYLHNIYKKSGVQNRADAVKAAVDLRLLHWPFVGDKTYRLCKAPYVYTLLQKLTPQAGPGAAYRLSNTLDTETCSRCIPI